jgi:hypothetical protein
MVGLKKEKLVNESRLMNDYTVIFIVKKVMTKQEFFFKSASATPATSNLKESEYLIFEVPKELAKEFEPDQEELLVLKGLLL